MLGYRLDQAKGMFFDRPAVQKAMDRKAARALSRFGAFVRTRALRSIHPSKKTSKPGKPPRSHLGLLRRGILFVYEPAQQSVVIGPYRLSGRLGNAPEALEKGGLSVVLTGSRRSRGTRSAFIRKRPYMQPAFEAELPGAAKLFGQ